LPSYRDLQGNEISSSSDGRERISRAIAPTSQSVICDRCGSSYFHTVYVEQFAGGGYGSMEFRSITGSPIPLRICVCGTVKSPENTYVPGSRAIVSAREELVKSLQDAKRYQDQNAASLLLDRVAKATASKNELTDLRNELNARIDRLESGTLSAPQSTPYIAVDLGTKPQGTAPTKKKATHAPTSKGSST
jgi:hypothetical protein